MSERRSIASTLNLLLILIGLVSQFAGFLLLF